MEWVYPKIKEYCKEKHGLEFQVYKQNSSMLYTVQCTAACMAEYQTNCAAQVLNQETRNNILEYDVVEFFYFRDQKMMILCKG